VVVGDGGLGVPKGAQGKVAWQSTEIPAAHPRKNGPVCAPHFGRIENTATSKEPQWPSPTDILHLFVGRPQGLDSVYAKNGDTLGGGPPN
jgi:hypothetical protein